jgi:hypothetical protein
MKPFPFHLTRRQSLWSAAAIVAVDLFWFRVALPLLMSSASNVGVVFGVLASLALVVLHIDVAWSFIDPAADNEYIYTCHFCDSNKFARSDKYDNGVPDDWTVFQHGRSRRIVACGESGCRVAIAKSMAETLTFHP